MLRRPSLPRLAAAAALAGLAALAACAGSRASGPLEPVDPAQAAGGAPGEAVGEAAGVAVRVGLDDWRGRPPDLEQRLTPVDVTLQNRSGRVIRVDPETFALVVGGRRLRVLDRGEVSRALADLAGSRRRPAVPRVGAVGGPTFPGYDQPTGNFPVPPAGQWYPSQLPSGTIKNGDGTSVLLFFDTPAQTLKQATFEVDVAADDGTKLGTIRIPYDRGG